MNDYGFVNTGIIGNIMPYALKRISARTMISQANLTRPGIKKIIVEYNATLKK
jgi:hypothetical protein